MKAILHIGTEKTGTTTLQHFLHTNKDAFSQEGFHVVTSMGVGNNRALAGYAMRDDNLDDYHSAKDVTTPKQKREHDQLVEEKLTHELSQLEGSIHSVVFTSEHFHSRLVHEDEVNKLKLLLDRFFEEYKIVIYLRPQIDLATSLYSTVLRSGSKAEFYDFIQTNCNPTNIYYDYYSLLNRWSSVFRRDSIEVKIFDKNYLTEGDLLKDFASILQVSFDNLLWTPSLNESLSPVGQELLRLNNLYNYGFFVSGREFKTSLYDLVNKCCVGKGCSPDSFLAKKLQSAFDNINKHVSREWFGGDDLFLVDYAKYEDSNFLKSSEKEVLSFLLSSYQNVRESEVNLIRDSALLLEHQDLNVARDLMELAHKLRPNGKFIERKLNSYRKL